jgi:hypothetical protein
MPFITLNNDWSSLASRYNQNFNNKPSVPALKYLSFDDGLIRGGVLNATLASVRDTARIGKFFLSGKGLLFSAKQAGLQLSNPRLESKIENGDFSDKIAYKTIGPTRVFNFGVNELASVAGNAFGLHFDRAGLFPIIPDDQKYEAVAYYNNYTFKNNTATKDSTNRLVRYASFINNAPFGKQELDTYQGGAQSVYGIFPKTIISTTDVRTTLRDVILTQSGSLSTIAPGSKTIASATPTSALKLRNTTLENQLSSSISPNNQIIANQNIEKRIGVSNRSNLDSINTINIIDSKTFYDYSEGNNGGDSSQINSLSSKKVFNNASGSTSPFANDLIKFRIEFLNNESPSLAGILNTDVLAFRAYLDDFSDGMNAKWDSYRYMGRGEEFYVYNGFTRDIGVSFTIHAHNEQEMAPLYSKLNYLMSTFTPDYSSQLKMRGNISYLTVGDYIYRQPGVFTDIKISGLLESSWDIGLNKDGTANGQYELPRMVKVGLSFKPIHTFLPRRNYSGPTTGIQTIPATFITPDRNAYPTIKDGKKNRYLNTGGWSE